MSKTDPASYGRIETECPGFQARATARALTRYFNACFRPFGITAEQFSLLVGIGARRDPTLAELAARAGVDTTTLSRSVQNLQRRGLVGAEGGRGRAGKRLALTATGHALLEEAMSAWEDARTRLATGMGEEMLKTTKRAMSDLADAVETTPPNATSPADNGA